MELSERVLKAAAVMIEPPGTDEVTRRLSVVRNRIESAGGDSARVKVVAVTKGFTVRAVQAAVEAGICDIGENYAQEMLEKVAALAEPSEGARTLRAREGLCWHYLGSIQRRRVKDIAGVVRLWQTVSRLEEGEAIARRCAAARVLVEVETTGIPGRNGCSPAMVAGLVHSLGDLDLEVDGLMTIGPPGDLDGSRRAFRTTATLGHDLGLRELSMGMSDDLEVAVEQGATMVRVGRALFGEREPREPGR